MTTRERRVFFVSDRTGITIETLARSLLSQFPGHRFVRETLPFVDTPEIARTAARRIELATADAALPPLVFATLTDPALRAIISAAAPHVFDLFGTFIGPLEAELGETSAHSVGRAHGISDALAYEQRLDVIDYALAHDDGLKPRGLAGAEVVLVGVSRSGKTPTSLYLAMHYHLKAANYPLTEDDFARGGLPAVLEPVRDRLHGLTIAPDRLSRIRDQRRAGGRYASLAQCRQEVAAAEALFRAHGIPFLDTTAISIEEIAATIVRDRGPGRRT